MMTDDCWEARMAARTAERTAIAQACERVADINRRYAGKLQQLDLAFRAEMKAATGESHQNLLMVALSGKWLEVPNG
jgi:hypothetical protein